MSSRKPRSIIMGFRPVEITSCSDVVRETRVRIPVGAPFTPCGGYRAWSKVQGLGPCRVGVHGFESGHLLMLAEIPIPRTTYIFCVSQEILRKKWRRGSDSNTRPRG